MVFRFDSKGEYTLNLIHIGPHTNRSTSHLESFAHGWASSKAKSNGVMLGPRLVVQQLPGQQGSMYIVSVQFIANRLTNLAIHPTNVHPLWFSLVNH